MTEQEMMKQLELARRYSLEKHTTVWAMSNGSFIKYTLNYANVKILQNTGYWVCSIFEDGHRVEA